MWIYPALGETVRKPYADLRVSLLHSLAQTWSLQSLSHLKTFVSDYICLKFYFPWSPVDGFQMFFGYLTLSSYSFFSDFFFISCICSIVFLKDTLWVQCFFVGVWTYWNDILWVFGLPFFYYLSSIFGNKESLYLGKSKSYNFIYGFQFIYYVKKSFLLGRLKALTVYIFAYEIHVIYFLCKVGRWDPDFRCLLK